VVKKQPINVIRTVAMLPYGLSIFMLLLSISMIGDHDNLLPGLILILTALLSSFVGQIGLTSFRLIQANEKRIAKLEQQLAGEVVREEGE